jgi:rhodanese-related sulfurtransferase
MPQIIISRDELKERVNNGAHLVEVLPAKEFARAHLPGRSTFH